MPNPDDRMAPLILSPPRIARRAMRASAAWIRRVILPVGALAALVVAAEAQPAPGPGAAVPAASEARQSRTELMAFAVTPFPFDGTIPEKEVPFLDVRNGDRRGHTSPRGGVYWSDETYSDRRVLVSIPAGFDLDQPGYVVVFLHGNSALLGRDVRDRQRVPQQVERSGLNAVLLAPQFAVNALDSSAGRFWEPGVFAAFLDEASAHLADLYGDEAAAARFGRLPVILVGYSGGYLASAFTLARGGAEDRLAGVILFDAIYGEEAKFAAWAEAAGDERFFFSAYSQSAAESNRIVQGMLRAAGVAFAGEAPAAIGPGTIAFLSAGAVVHNDFVTRAWVDNPLQWTLARVVPPKGENRFDAIFTPTPLDAALIDALVERARVRPLVQPPAAAP